MRITINDRSSEVSDRIREHIDQKLGKLDKYFRVDAEAIVRLSLERGMYIAEITVNSVPMVFRAQEKTGDIVASIDNAVDTIDHQIRKNKTRLEKRLRSGAFDKLPLDETPEEVEEIYKVIRTKRFVMKPMSVDEAILQMNLLGHHFYAFKNIEDGDRFCVIYVRDSGGYGIIESD